MSVKITEAGQPCRHCRTPVRKNTRFNPPAFRPGGYYYSWTLLCPKCSAVYIVESAKVWFDKPASFDFATDPEIAARATKDSYDKTPAFDFVNPRQRTKKMEAKHSGPAPAIGQLGMISSDWKPRDASILPWD